MGVEYLEAAIQRVGSPVELLRNSTVRPTSLPGAPEFTNWRAEQSHHMTDLNLSGKDSLRLLSDFGANTFAHFDEVVRDGQTIGLSLDLGYIGNEQDFVSLATVDAAHSERGTEVTVLWENSPARPSPESSATARSRSAPPALPLRTSRKSEAATASPEPIPSPRSEGGSMVNLSGTQAAGGRRRRSSLADLVRNMGYEVMPFKNTEQDVLGHVPTSVPLTVTVTEAKGIDTTLGLTERLLGHGYQVAPHLPARQFVDDRHVADVIARLVEAGTKSVFVIGGDAPTPAGEFTDAFSLLQAMDEIGHPFDQVGIGGYPEGHGSIPQDAIDLALKQKSPLATRVVTQICFRAKTTATWAGRIAEDGVDLPVFVGLPGPVTRQKLIRITAGIGLGQSARFLQKQQNLLWKFLLPGAYKPTRLVRALGAAAPKIPNNIAGLHIFTFNELRKTERWRQELLAAVRDEDRS